MTEQQIPNQPTTNFGKLSMWFKGKALYIWTSIWILFGLFLGLISLDLYSDIKLFRFGTVIIWAFAYFLVGALIGCIFGVPKSISDASKTVIKPNSGIPAQTPGGIIPVAEPNATSAIVTQNSGDVANSNIQNTTNLTDISDWLAKIVVGAGLVQLKEIPSFVLKVANRMATGIDLHSTFPTNILCAGIIVYYVCFGLISGYFVMRTIFLKLL